MILEEKKQMVGMCFVTVPINTYPTIIFPQIQREIWDHLFQCEGSIISKTRVIMLLLMW